jgi:hypothetical protein
MVRVIVFHPEMLIYWRSFIVFIIRRSWGKLKGGRDYVFIGHLP